MRSIYRFITLTCLLFSPAANAVNLFADALYWRASESVDWAFTNNLNSTNQDISYLTMAFGFKPGIRIGAELPSLWHSKVYYTYYHTNTSDSSSNVNITSAFLAAKLSKGNFTSGQVDFNINYHTLDLEFSQLFHTKPSLTIEPFVGLKAANIDQTIATNFQGDISITETLTNDFKGIGPQTGVYLTLGSWEHNALKFNLNSKFSAGYLWGTWRLTDFLHQNPRSTATDIDIDPSSNKFGSLVIGANVGASVNYQNLTLALSYDLNDWFNQVQIIDDATGAHDNDLILQGLIFSATINL